MKTSLTTSTKGVGMFRGQQDDSVESDGSRRRKVDRRRRAVSQGDGSYSTFSAVNNGPTN